MVRRSFFVGNSPSTEGACWFCYSHSSYYTDVPSEVLMNGKGQFIDERGNMLPEGQKADESYFYKDYEKKWGDPTDGVNRSSPKLVLPREGNKDDYKPNPY